MIGHWSIHEIVIADRHDRYHAEAGFHAAAARGAQAVAHRPPDPAGATQAGQGADHAPAVAGHRATDRHSPAA